MKTEQKHGVPAMLSFFFIGLGQVVKGHVFKGITMHLLAWFLFILCFFLIGIPLLFILWIYNISDAYNSNYYDE